MIYFDASKCIDAVIAKVGNNIILGTPLGMGKPNHLLNAFYQRAKENPDIQLKIFTALTLEKPKGKSLLEKRFLEPFVERVFGDYPDLNYELDRVKGALPENVEVVEFYFPAGKFMHNKYAQRNYISTNYTHAYREMMDHGVNVLAQLICEGKVHGKKYYNLSCNPDVSVDVLKYLKEQDSKGNPTAIVGQINNNLPFMYGEAIVEKDDFEFVYDNPADHYKLFGPPKLSVTPKDYMIGLYASTLVRDDGELQVGIGSLGDAVVYALKMRQEDNATYNKILERLNVKARFGETIHKLGDTDTFNKGLLGATEMFVDGFKHLWKCGILKRKVYNDLIIQRLLNEEAMDETISMETLDLLLQRHAIHYVLSEEDFEYLQKFGILKRPQELRYYSGVMKLNDGREIEARLDKPESREQIEKYCLGDKLKNGAVIHGGFFLGAQDFYQWLRDLPDEERQLIHMRSVRTINQLFGHEDIDRLHRKNARFINTCLIVTMLGAVVSDGLEDGTVISGVGGQYNFVAMAQELPDGYSIIQLRSTFGEGKSLRSNIVWNYGHVTIPRHLRDIVVTEYGIANIRGKTDEEVIKALLNIADARFQEQLMAQAKKAGKLDSNYQIPEQYRNNLPQSYSSILKEFSKEGLFPAFPFGTDFTKEEQVIGKALKFLKKRTSTKPEMIRAVVKAIVTTRVPQSLLPYVKRMGLEQPKGIREKLYQKLLVNALKETI